MIKEEDIRKIGKFQKTHGLKGEMNAMIDIDWEFLEEDYPLIVDIDGAFVPFYVESVRPKGAETALIKLEDVDFDEASSQFVNKQIWARKSDLADFFELEENELLDDDDLKGFTVKDVNGQVLGTVAHIDSNTINTLLVVDRISDTDGDEREIFIPFVDDFVVEINPEEKLITVDLPEGLLDL